MADTPDIADHAQIPVLWLCGPPGVGKTTVAWEIRSRLIREGVDAGFVDIDQLGMCFPEPADDPGRYRMKTANLRSVVAHFQAAGARCVIVSGVLDAARGVAAEEIPQARLSVCRLRADHDQLAERFRARQGENAPVTEVLREAEALDAGGVPGVCVDTTGRTVGETAELVGQRCGFRPAGPANRQRRAVLRSTTADGSVLWLCGPGGVGKSATGFAVYQQILHAGHTVAFVDLDQLAFCGPPGDHRLKAANLAALWETYHAAGARHLVITGPAEDAATVKTYTEALPGTAFTVCRLHAGADQLAHRIMLRGQGEGWPQPGDPLIGLPPEQLRRIAGAAAAQADSLEHAGLGDLRVDTTTRTAQQAAEEVIARTGFGVRAKDSGEVPLM
ncbi:Adenylylsulfate kinase [Saccharopolyspora antimicrobica]|uniref:Adenylylsulfate kinase n=1 Tax=Saccharopolyspora antimicrobica TaxID=455193 RepID=A0A1I4RGN8_9PSEU|nr:AAA family ATPase [Saccharopolyspora antimicrobica]RKT88017.1 adenylylsulfate kinase-like enzyme [Saccharopolyspora antimicrobica]SFM51395.1 Adenylylsulfate kinase [Saccharopolyspora antimicrobica]